MIAKDLPRILEAWSREHGAELTPVDDGQKEYFELSWRHDHDSATRYIDVFALSNEMAAVQHGSYIDPRARHRGTISRAPYERLPDVLSALRPIVDEMSPLPRRHSSNQDVGTVKSLRFR